MYRDAIRYYREAIQVDSLFAQAYNNLGIVYYTVGEYENALEVFDKCLSSDHDFHEAYFNRSNVYYELQSYQNAIDDLNKIEGNYNSPETILFLKGAAFFNLKNYDSARYLFERTLKFDTSNVETYINLASTFFFKDDLVSAENLALKALGIDSLSSDAYNILGMIKAAMKEYQLAISYYDQGMKLKSNNAFILNNRGYVFMQLGEMEKAIEDINKSIVIDPDNSWAYRNKGIYFYNSEDYANAERLLNRSIEMNDSLPLSHYFLGKIYIRRGNNEQACQEFKAAIYNGDKEAKEPYRLYCQ